MTKQEIEESVRVLENFTTNICDKFGIENDDEVLEVRDYITEREFGEGSKEWEVELSKRNKGIILYLMHFKICNDVFPTIEVDTINRKIKFEISYDGGDNKLFINMLNGTCLQNLKSLLPHINMLVCKIIDLSQSFDQHNSEEFLQTLQRDFTINEVLD
jgi:hypothetical protein